MNECAIQYMYILDFDARRRVKSQGVVRIVSKQCMARACCVRHWAPESATVTVDAGRRYEI